MRELEFRAYSVKEKKYYQVRSIDFFLRRVNIDTDGTRIWFSFDNNDWILEQSTGELDEKGIPIFEGDIIRYVSEDGELIRAAVKFCRTDNPDTCVKGFVTMDWFNISDTVSKEEWDYISDDYLIIGNIHDNRGLLKEENEQ